VLNKTNFGSIKGSSIFKEDTLELETASNETTQPEAVWQHPEQQIRRPMVSMNTVSCGLEEQIDQVANVCSLA